MKRKKNKGEGFTLLEMVISTGIIALAGSMILLVLNTGTSLALKNSSINVTHNQARIAYMRIVEDIHNSASGIMCSGSTVTVAGGYAQTGQAITFQVIRGGPFYLNATLTNGVSQVAVNIAPGSFWPVVGERFILPLSYPYTIEADITGVNPVTNPNTSATSAATLTLSCSTSTLLSSSGSTEQSGTGIPVLHGPLSIGANYNYPCYFTDRVTFMVSGTPTATGTAIAAWFNNVYPVGTIGTNLSYASLVGTGSNDLLYFYHNLASGTLTMTKIARELVNGTNTAIPPTPFTIQNSVSSTPLSGPSVYISNLSSADTLHYSQLVNSGSTLRFNPALMGYRNMNMTLTSGTLYVRMIPTLTKMP